MRGRKRVSLFTFVIRSTVYKIIIIIISIYQIDCIQCWCHHMLFV